MNYRSSSHLKNGNQNYNKHKKAKYTVLVTCHLLLTKEMVKVVETAKIVCFDFHNLKVRKSLYGVLI
jgi:hypothetical protein